MDSSMIGYSAGGSAIVLALFFTIQQCVKHKIHTKFISGCCQAEIDIDTSTPPSNLLIKTPDPKV